MFSSSFFFSVWAQPHFIFGFSFLSFRWRRAQVVCREKKLNYGFRWWLGCWEYVSFFASVLLYTLVYVRVTFCVWLFCDWDAQFVSIWFDAGIGLSCICMITWWKGKWLELLQFSERRPMFVAVLLVIFSSLQVTGFNFICICRLYLILICVQYQNIII